MNLEDVKALMRETGWGILATTDGETVGARPIGGWAWMETELWCATFSASEKIAHLKKVPQAEYCFTTTEGRHVRISGPCALSTTIADKRRLYEAVPLLKKYIPDPASPDYIVIRMTPERIRMMETTDMKYQAIELP